MAYVSSSPFCCYQGVQVCVVLCLHLSAKITEVRFIYSVRTNANTTETAETSQQGKYFSILHITDPVSADF